MALQEILLDDATFSVPRVALMTNCPKLLDDTDLPNSPYRVRSAVGGDALQLFLAVVDGTTPEPTTENMNELFLLCEEFGFEALLSTVSDFRSEHAVDDHEARKRVCRVEEQTTPARSGPLFTAGGNRGYAGSAFASGDRKRPVCPGKPDPA
jgi:hypothetical protein